MVVLQHYLRLFPIRVFTLVHRKRVSALDIVPEAVVWMEIEHIARDGLLVGSSHGLLPCYPHSVRQIYRRCLTPVISIFIWYPTRPVKL